MCSEVLLSPQVKDWLDATDRDMDRLVQNKVSRVAKVVCTAIALGSDLDLDIDHVDFTQASLNTSIFEDLATTGYTVTTSREGMEIVEGCLLDHAGSQSMASGGGQGVPTWL